MSLTVVEFFEQKGAVEIFCEIGKDGKQFKDINNNVSISHQTLSTRLRQAKEASLLDKEIVNLNDQIWRPTFPGKEIYDELVEQGVVEHYEVFRVSRQEFEKAEASFTEWVNENGEDIVGDEIWSLGKSSNTYKKPDNPPDLDPTELTDKDEISDDK